MAAIKCKMCGGDLIIEEGSTVAECKHCGSRQTIPNQDNGKKSTRSAGAMRTTAIVAARAVVSIAVFLVFIKVMIPYNKYHVAAALMETANVGDTVLFGTYEQDNKTFNGKEDIAWIVLAKEDGKILVISKYALDCQPYNTTRTDVTWESCSLRDWLNGTFWNAAFSPEEQALILNTTVSADRNPQYRTNPGNATTDKVFLLSINEAEKYFNRDKARRCAPTAYAKAQGAFTSDFYKTASGDDTCWWWLRSPGRFQYWTAKVDYDGSFYYSGIPVDYSDACVRPALWIGLNA